MKQARKPHLQVETEAGKIDIGGAADLVPYRLESREELSARFVPTRGIDEKKCTARAEQIKWSHFPSHLKLGAEVSFNFLTLNNLQALKLTEWAQLNHVPIHCRVTTQREVSTGRELLTIKEILNVDELKAASGLEKVLFSDI